MFKQISKASAAVSSTIEKSTEPIRKTAAYKSLSETLVDALDDSGSAKHAGFEEKEARRQRRQRRLAKAGKGGGLGPAGSRVVADPEFVLLTSVLKHLINSPTTELARQ
jgi:import inner membrane translocase subunit TIM44